MKRVWDPLPDVTYASDFTYHPSGSITGYRAGNGIPFTFGYHTDRYWPTSIQAGVLDLTYNYDETGNVESVADSRGSGWNQSFTYDPLDRLKTATGAYSPFAYEYDAHGNMQSNGVDTFTYDPVTLRLTSRGAQTFSYDDNGSVKADGVGVYGYAVRNQMTTATINGATSTYKYDADEWRTLKTTPDGTTTYYLRGLNGRLLSELIVTAAGTENRREYIYAGSRLIAVVER